MDKIISYIQRFHSEDTSTLKKILLKCMSEKDLKRITYKDVKNVIGGAFKKTFFNIDIAEISDIINSKIDIDDEALNYITKLLIDLVKKLDHKNKDELYEFFPSTFSQFIFYEYEKQSDRYYNDFFSDKIEYLAPNADNIDFLAYAIDYIISEIIKSVAEAKRKGEITIKDIKNAIKKDDDLNEIFNKSMSPPKFKEKIDTPTKYTSLGYY